MKRSVMIDWISDYLQKKIMIRDNYIESQRHANNILKLIEELGMSPPSHTDNISGEFLTSWEQENE